MFSEDQPVVGEKFAAQNKEQDDAGDNLRGGFIQLKFTGDLGRPVAHEYQEKGNQNHDEGIELRQPGDDNGGKAPASGGAGGDGVPL